MHLDLRCSFSIKLLVCFLFSLFVCSLAVCLPVCYPLMRLLVCLLFVGVFAGQFATCWLVRRTFTCRFYLSFVRLSVFISFGCKIVFSLFISAFGELAIGLVA